MGTSRTEKEGKEKTNTNLPNISDHGSEVCLSSYAFCRMPCFSVTEHSRH